MKRRDFLCLAPVTLALPLVPGALWAADRVFYKPGLAEAAMQDGKVILLDFWTNWCTTCAAQDRVVDALRAANPAYDKAVTFITVDWDKYAESDLSKSLQIPRRSTLVALKGKVELGRIVAGTSRADIKALMDQALTAAAA